VAPTCKKTPGLLGAGTIGSFIIGLFIYYTGLALIAAGGP
jgi:hypothetical protein